MCIFKHIWSTVHHSIDQRNMVIKAGSRLLFNCLTPAQWHTTHPLHIWGISMGSKQIPKVGELPNQGLIKSDLSQVQHKLFFLCVDYRSLKQYFNPYEILDNFQSSKMVIKMCILTLVTLLLFQVETDAGEWLLLKNMH